MNKQIQEVNEWREIRPLLNGNYNFSSDWQKAVDIFKKRIDNKYLKPVERLINTNLRKGEGFTIVTI